MSTPDSLDSYQKELAEWGRRLPTELRNELQALHLEGVDNRQGICWCNAEDHGSLCCVSLIVGDVEP